MVPKRNDEDLDEILTWNLVRAARLTARRMSKRLVEFDLNPVTFGVLAQLSVASPMTQADLARAVLIRPQSIATLLEGLEQRDLIRREGDRTRGRRNPVVLTDAGHALLDRAWDTVIETNDLSGDGFDPEETIELNRLLRKLVRAGS
jgi:DNA-binding MarR family transcriptional regulator